MARQARQLRFGCPAPLEGAGAVEGAGMAEARLYGVGGRMAEARLYGEGARMAEVRLHGEGAPTATVALVAVLAHRRTGRRDHPAKASLVARPTQGWRQTGPGTAFVWRFEALVESSPAVGCAIAGGIASAAVTFRQSPH